LPAEEPSMARPSDCKNMLQLLVHRTLLQFLAADVICVACRGPW